MSASSHFGVYALIVCDAKILLVRKTRGLYDGLLDLPGGSPHDGERDHEITLARELAEEVRASLVGIDMWRPFEFTISADSRGRAIDFRHRGLWTFAEIESAGRGAAIASDDTSGTEWLPHHDWRSRLDLSAVTMHVLAAADLRHRIHRRAVNDTEPPTF